jgi:5-formyltetrahydrofolate cyclo-ligase
MNQNLRKTILTRRNTLTVDEQSKKSEQILSSLMAFREVQLAKTFFIYVNFRSEVQTIPFIIHCLSEGKTVLVPVTLVAEKKLLAVRITDIDGDLEAGYSGIPEPVPSLQQTMETDPSFIDMIILPGSVFDRRGGRLGYGGGYYDRFLVDAAPQAVRVAVAYESQLIDRIELQPHDQLMDWIVTEKKIYSCRRKPNA